MVINKKYDGYIGILMPTPFAKIRSTDFTSPLGQTILATYLADRISGFQTVVIDGERTDVCDIPSLVEKTGIRNPLIGFSLLSGNTHSTFVLAQQLSGQGLGIIIGGPEVTAYGAEKIMDARPFITYGVIGAGEQIIYLLMNGNDLGSIPNLTYREKNVIYTNPLNQKIESFNSILDVKPEEGLYSPSDNKIEMYIYSNQNEFIHTLAHEFGHALGLPHTLTSGSMMYPTTGSSLSLSAEDITILHDFCKERSVMEIVRNDLEQAVRNFFVSLEKN